MKSLSYSFLLHDEICGHTEKGYQILILESTVSFALLRHAGFVHFCWAGRGRECFSWGEAEHFCGAGLGGASIPGISALAQDFVFYIHNSLFVQLWSIWYFWGVTEILGQCTCPQSARPVLSTAHNMMGTSHQHQNYFNFNIKVQLIPPHVALLNTTSL